MLGQWTNRQTRPRRLTVRPTRRGREQVGPTRMLREGSGQQQWGPRPRAAAAGRVAVGSGRTAWSWGDAAGARPRHPSHGLLGAQPSAALCTPQTPLTVAGTRRGRSCPLPGPHTPSSLAGPPLEWKAGPTSTFRLKCAEAPPSVLRRGFRERPHSTEGLCTECQLGLAGSGTTVGLPPAC